jgi:hypothetical protein
MSLKGGKEGKQQAIRRASVFPLAQNISPAKDHGRAEAALPLSMPIANCERMSMPIDTLTTPRAA